MRTTLAALWLSLFDASLAATNWDVFEYGVVETFQRHRPFPEEGEQQIGFDLHCKADKTFHAKMYRLSDLPDAPPTGLAPWRHGIEDFLSHKPYPGSWDGVDHKGENRELVVMEYVDVPEAVRVWIDEQQRKVNDTADMKWWYGVFTKPKDENDNIFHTAPPRPTAPAAGEVTYQAPDVPDKDKIVVFPGAAVYENAPLWVAEGSSCERPLSTLEKYKPSVEEDSVLGWVVEHSKPQRDHGRRDITFKVEAMFVTETYEAKRSRLMWEKLHRTLRRNDRKMKKEERRRARQEIEHGRVKDEL
ncbi:hypothetical protein QBC39DRAFT_315647 [Podospora conica]|nr:hypothetical protein QBC39DRAFT_315647 [Schizothecium conicum]